MGVWGFGCSYEPEFVTIGNVITFILTNTLNSLLFYSNFWTGLRKMKETINFWPPNCTRCPNFSFGILEHFSLRLDNQRSPFEIFQGPISSYKYAISFKLGTLGSKLPLFYLNFPKIVLDFGSRFEPSTNCQYLWHISSRVPPYESILMMR